MKLKELKTKKWFKIASISSIVGGVCFIVGGSVLVGTSADVQVEHELIDGTKKKIGIGTENWGQEYTKDGHEIHDIWRRRLDIYDQMIEMSKKYDYSNEIDDKNSLITFVNSIKDTVASKSTPDAKEDYNSISRYFEISKYDTFNVVGIVLAAIGGAFAVAGLFTSIPTSTMDKIIFFNWF
ncbi:MAG: hypothetical protein ACRC42_04755 [Mycoplasma sp.]